MATLYKRATPSQAMILRIVEGSIKNACDAHKSEFNPYLARSIAKRAAGTLTAEFPAVLAAKPSEKLGLATSFVMANRAARKAQLVEPSDGSKLTRGQKAERSKCPKASPLRSLEKYLFQQMRGIKARGEIEKANAFIEVLRKIAVLKAE